MAGRNPYRIIPAPPGIDATSDIAHPLNPGRAQQATNLIGDRPSLLRANFTWTRVCTTVDFSSYNLNGIDMWYQNPAQQTTGTLSYPCGGGTVSPNTEPSLLVVLQAGVAYYSAVESTGDPVSPTGTPPTVPFFHQATYAPPTSLIFGQTGRVRSAQFTGELIMVQNGTNTDTSEACVPVRFTNNATFVNYVFMLGMCPPDTTQVNNPIECADRRNIFVTGTGVLDGAYQYGFTWVDEAGRESSLAICVFTLSPSDQTITIQASDCWPDNAPPSAVSMNIYRTQASGTLFYLVTNIPVADFSTFSYSDNTADSVLAGGQISPHPGQNDVPNPASLIIVYKGHVILDDLINVGTLQIGNLNSATQFCTAPVVVPGSITSDGTRFPVATNYGEIITGFALLGDSLAIWTNFGMYELFGDDVGNFDRRPIHAIGCIASDSIVRCDNLILFLSYDGIHAIDYATGFQTNFLSIELNTLIQSLPWSERQAAQAVYYENAYYLNIGTTTFRYDLSLPSPAFTVLSSPAAWAAATVTKLAGQRDWPYACIEGSQPYVLNTWPAESTLAINTLTYQIPATGDRSSQQEVKRVRLYGTGAITSGTITINCDGGGKSASVNAVLCFPEDPNQLCLLEWTNPGANALANKGYLIDFTFSLTGSNLILGDVVVEYANTDR